MHVAESNGTQGPPLITIEDAAKVLNISRSAAYRAAAAGQIPTLRLGRRLWVPIARLRRMLGWEAMTEEQAS
jgi:excisionase family DNA binding protein